MLERSWRQGNHLRGYSVFVVWADKNPVLEGGRRGKI